MASASSIRNQNAAVGRESESERVDERGAGDEDRLCAGLRIHPDYSWQIPVRTDDFAVSFNGQGYGLGERSALGNYGLRTCRRIYAEDRAASPSCPRVC